MPAEFLEMTPDSQWYSLVPLIDRVVVLRRFELSFLDHG